MTKQSVLSSNISSIGYESESSTLEMEFLDGSVYQYHGVPQSVYESLMAAASHGEYFSRNIKNTYSFIKIR